MTLPPLQADAIMEAVERETGLHDYGDPTLPDRFAQVVQLLQAAGMDETGQAAAVATCARLLSDRLCFFDDRRRFPDLADEQIAAPLFATGEPRSGTTLLHMLLSLDPDSRSLRFWEVMSPSPPPGTVPGVDPRLASADADWRDINQQIPKWLSCHPYNDMLGDGLPECERTWAFDFRVMTPTAWWRVPLGMTIGGLPTDPVAQYRIHKMMLQQMQYRRPKKRWALKGFHGPRLGAFFATYPDARLIWTHRDPVQVTASRIAMAMALTEGLTGRAELKEQAAIHLAASRAGFNQTLNNPLIDDPRIFHVRYPDFVRDPVGTVEAFYRFSGLRLSDYAARAMTDYLNTHRSDRYGRFEYSTELIGVDVEQLHAEFAPYRARFGLEIERR